MSLQCNWLLYNVLEERQPVCYAMIYMYAITGVIIDQCMVWDPSKIWVSISNDLLNIINRDMQLFVEVFPPVT